jgi:hypothetical protein
MTQWFQYDFSVQSLDSIEDRVFSSDPHKSVAFSAKGLM